MFIGYSIISELIIVLVVEFDSPQYTGSESSGFVEAVVIISGGSSTIPISVTVDITAARQTASGKELMHITIHYHTL